MKILLDTCTFLWLTCAAKELSEQARFLFQNTENSVFLSSVSVWEIVVKNKIVNYQYLTHQRNSLMNNAQHILLKTCH